MTDSCHLKLKNKMKAIKLDLPSEARDKITFFSIALRTADDWIKTTDSAFGSKIPELFFLIVVFLNTDDSK